MVRYHVEQEANAFLKKKIYDWQSQYQSDAIPIPQLPRLAPPPKTRHQVPSQNFMGRVVRVAGGLRRTHRTRRWRGW